MRLQTTLVGICYFMIQMFSGFATSVQGQTQEQEKVYLVDSSADSACELNNFYLNQLMSEKEKQPKDRIFIISRLSKGEKASIGWKRLMTAYYVLTTGTKISTDQILIAAGTKTKEKKGRIEFYLGGKLILISIAEKGKNVCLTCCADK